MGHRARETRRSARRSLQRDGRSIAQCRAMPVMSSILTLSFAALASVARAECPTAYEFVVITDDAGELTLVDPDFVRGRSIPSLGPDGRVAFTAWLDAGGRAVMVGDENALVARVRDLDADPASQWRWLDEVRFGGDVAFFDGELERDGAGYPALGAVNDARIVALVAVAGERFASISDFDVSATGVVAFGAYDAMLGPVIAAARFGESPRIIESGASSAYGGVAIGDGDDVSYVVATPAGQQLVAANGAAVAETDASTGLGPELPISMGPGTAIAYVFAYADADDPGSAGQRIRRYDPSTLTSTTLADSARGDFSRHADGVKVSLLDQTGLAGTGTDGWGGCVAFLGQGDEGRDTIFIADEDGVGIVVTEGVEIDGGVVGILDMGPMAVYATGQIAFWASLGTNRRAIVRADPVRGPRPDGGGEPDAGAVPVEPPGAEPGGCLSASATRADPVIAFALVFVLVALRRRARPARLHGACVLASMLALGCEECEGTAPVDAGSADAGDAGDPGDGGDAGLDAGDTSLDAGTDGAIDGSIDGSIDADAPVRCPGPRVASVSFRALHGGHGCAVTTSGELRCWGTNFDGELGRGTTSDGYERASPVAVGAIDEVETSEGFTCARAGGELTCWGRNNLGQLGDGNRPIGSTVPLPMPSVRAATSVDSGRYAICATTSGRPVCWGWDMMSSLTRPVVRSLPMAEPRLPTGATQIALGELAACALASGRVVCDGAEGAFGPLAIDDATAIGSGVRHFCAARTGGAILCWGQNFAGQLGDGTTTDDRAGVAVAGLTDTIAIAGGWGHTCAIRDDGSVWCWGANNAGQLGRGTIGDEEPLPAEVPGLTGVVRIDGGYDATCAVTSAGDLFCWGHLDYGDARREMLPDPTCVDLGP